MNDSESKKQIAKMQQAQSDEPTGLMGTQVALNIAQGVIDAMNEASVTKSQILSWDQQELRAIAKRATQKILGLAGKKEKDLWFEEKMKIEKFYKEYFNRIIDWSLVSLPQKSDLFKKIEYIFADITEDQILEAYAKKFGKEKMCLAWKSVTNVIQKQQNRPAGDYVFAHIGGIEIDLPNKSYNHGIMEEIKFMIPREGFIAAFRERTETGNMYDFIGLTRFAALDKYKNAMHMYRYTDGKFYVDSYFRDNQDLQGGLRRVSF